MSEFFDFDPSGQGLHGGEEVSGDEVATGLELRSLIIDGEGIA